MVVNLCIDTLAAYIDSIVLHQSIVFTQSQKINKKSVLKYFYMKLY